MLVLSRRVGESVVIGDDVVVTVLEVRGDVVRVGVDAPRSVTVHRQEVVEELAAANRAAASPSDEDVAGLGAMVRRREDAETGPDDGQAGGRATTDNEPSP